MLGQVIALQMRASVVSHSSTEEASLDRSAGRVLLWSLYVLLEPDGNPAPVLIESFEDFAVDA